ncbi:MAG: hypothetical protein ACK51W_16240, partial [Aphanizomenon sp.]
SRGEEARVQVAGCGGRINFYLFSIPFPESPITNYPLPITNHLFPLELLYSYQRMIKKPKAI